MKKISILLFAIVMHIALYTHESILQVVSQIAKFHRAFQAQEQAYTTLHNAYMHTSAVLRAYIKNRQNENDVVTFCKQFPDLEEHEYAQFADGINIQMQVQEMWREILQKQIPALSDTLFQHAIACNKMRDALSVVSTDPELAALFLKTNFPDHLQRYAQLYNKVVWCNTVAIQHLSKSN